MQKDWFRKHMSDDPDADPVIEDAQKPHMKDKAPRPRRIRGKVSLMPEEPKAPTRKTGRMDALPKERSRAKRQRLPLDDQSEPPAPKGGAAADERYVRIRLRVAPDGLSVQDIKAVDGPLVADEDLFGDLAYEVTVGATRVASGSVPDAGINRAFPHPDPAPGQEGHHFVATPFQDILVRVPGDVVSVRDLPKVEIALYRLKEGPLPRAEGTEPVAQRFSRQLREVGRVRGIDLGALPKASRAEARRGLR